MATTNINNDVIITDTLIVSSSVGIGSTSLTGYTLRASKNITGGTTSQGIVSDGTIQSDATNGGWYFRTTASTQAAAFTTSFLNHFVANQGTFGAGSTVSNQYGFQADATLIGATNNFGFYGNIPAGANRWNIYMNGTADNYLAGSLGIGSTNLTGINLRIVKNITGLTTSYGILQDPIIQSGVTAAAYINRSLPYTVAASFTLSNLYHFAATPGTFGAGSTVTNQYGYFADGLTGATNNYGFFGNIPAATGEWNLFMNGTANNFLSGSLGIGNGKSVPTATLDVNGNTSISGSLIVSSSAVAASLQGSGSGVFTVDGTVGRLFSVDDSLTGSLFSVNTSAGLPVIEAFSNNTVRIGQYGQQVFYVSQSRVGIGKENALNGILDVSGSTTLTGSLSTTSTADFSGSVAIGITPVTQISLRVNKNITGNAVSSGITQGGTVQSDVTTLGRGIVNTLSTQAASFTLPDYFYFLATQSTIGAGSAVTSQIGYYVDNTLTGAGSNFAFRGDIASGANRWNIYMQGTANNYLAGNLGIGTTSLTGRSLSVTKNITGAVTSYGILSNGTIQSDVTNAVRLFNSVANTAAASFTLSSLVHYYAEQSTIGAGSAVTNQYGFYAESNLIGATNDYGFYGNLAAASNVWNLYMAGTANNFLAGNLGIGTTAVDTSIFRVLKNLTSTAPTAVSVGGEIQSTSTGQNNYISTNATTAAASFTVGAIRHINIQQGTFGAGSTVTDQYGVIVGASMVGGASNFAFYGDLPSGTNRWNLYMNGTANNYLAGALGIGSTGLAGMSLRVSKNITGATTGYGVHQDGVVQSDVTAIAHGFTNRLQTQATAFTLPQYNHYYAVQVTLGAGSAVTTQAGFFADSSLTSATNNYGFYGNIASGANRWNLFMAGTADNYMAGALGIGATNLQAINLFISKTLTGSVDSYHVNVNGVIQSDVTNSATYFRSGVSTAAGAFTLANLYHYTTSQGTIGAGSSVTNQYGFFVNSNLTGATNDYGFYGNLAAASNVWNLYMNGTANNYLAGNLGIGTTSIGSAALVVAKTLTGGTSRYGIYQAGQVQSDVTTLAIGIFNTLNTQATAFTLDSYTHINLQQGTIGVGSSVTYQYGLFIEPSLIGATYNYGIYANIPSGSNRWNLYVNGTASNYMAGALGIGSNSLTGFTLRVAKNSTGATNFSAIVAEGTIQSDVTSVAKQFYSYATTQAASFTLSQLTHFYAFQGTFGAGSTVTSQYGFFAESNMIGATNNYGFYGAIPSGSNRWNLYMNGNADNFVSGNLGIGTTTISNEGNLFLGAKGTDEGGQLFLQKGISYNSASMVDNYQDTFRVLTGTNTLSNRSDLVLSHVTRNLTIYGDVVAYGASDKRLKENIQPIENALDKLDKIGGYTFDWNDKIDIHGHEGRDIGVIAQEIEEVLPEVVATRDNGYKAVKYEKLTAYLIQVDKEQQQIIKDQQRQIDELRELINELKNK